MTITAELHNWKISPPHPFRPFEHYSGTIMGDVHKRFPDGRLVHTSKIMKLEGDLLHTKNSIYKLVPAPK